MEWPTIKLGDISEVITKGTTPTSVGFEFTASGVNFVKIESISLDGDFIPSKFAAVSNECHESLKRSQLKEGDILFSIAGALGRTALVTQKILPANTNQALAIIRIKKDVLIDKRYLILALKTGFTLEQIEKHQGGVAQQNLSLGQMKTFEIPLPPIPEQQRIVAILDQAFADIEKARANAEKNLKNARELFDSYLQQVFSQRGEGWAKETLKDVCSLITCGVASTPKYVDESVGIPFLSAQNVKNGKIKLHKYRFISREFHEKLTKKNKPEQGDVLYSRVGAGFGDAAIVDFNFEFSVYVSLTLIKPRLDRLSSEFLTQLLNSPLVKKQAVSSITSSGVPNLNVKSVREFIVFIPPLTTQKNVVEEIKLISEQQNQLKSVYQKKLSSLDELKKSLLQKAFSGELTKTEGMVA
jgi:type I restriction enzyme S subunit